MNQTRRTFLKGSLAGSAVAVAVGAGLLTPQLVLAAWPKAAFEARDVNAAMQGLYGATATTDSGKIKIKAPDIAENGAVVPVSVDASGLGSVSDVTIIAEKNGTPLAASFNLASNAEGFVSTRIKLSKTSKVIAVAKSGGTLYSSSKDIKVTIGGCGG